MYLSAIVRFLTAILLLPLLAAAQYSRIRHVSKHKGSWSLLSSIATSPRQEHTTVAVSPETLYILGGIDQFLPNQTTDPTTALVQSYSISDDTWRSSTNLPKPVNHINAAVVDGKIYVLGGLAPAPDGVWRAIPDCWVYSPKEKAWTAIGSMPEGHERGSAGVGVHGKTIFLAGGLLSASILPGGKQITVDTVSAYNTETGKWMPLESLPAPRDHMGAAVVGETFYVLGGHVNGNANVQNTVFALDLGDVAKGWSTRKARMPTPRGGIAAAVLGAKVYTFGGEGNPEPGSRGLYNQTEVYDTERDSWEALAPMEVPRHGTSAVGVDGKIFIPGGGISEGGAPVDIFDVFQPSCDTLYEHNNIPSIY